jgi:hypothetical protein
LHALILAPSPSGGYHIGMPESETTAVQSEAALGEAALAGLEDLDAGRVFDEAALDDELFDSE